MDRRPWNDEKQPEFWLVLDSDQGPRVPSEIIKAQQRKKKKKQDPQLPFTIVMFSYRSGSQQLSDDLEHCSTHQSPRLNVNVPTVRWARCPAPFATAIKKKTRMGCWPRDGTYPLWWPAVAGFRRASQLGKGEFILQMARIRTPLLALELSRISDQVKVHLGVLATRQARLVTFSLVSSLTPLDLTVTLACLAYHLLLIPSLQSLS